MITSAIPILVGLATRHYWTLGRSMFGMMINTQWQIYFEQASII